jgi:hypothetical protein
VATAPVPPAEAGTMAGNFWAGSTSNGYLTGTGTGTATRNATGQGWYISTSDGDNAHRTFSLKIIPFSTINVSTGSEDNHNSGRARQLRCVRDIWWTLED